MSVYLVHGPPAALLRRPGCVVALKSVDARVCKRVEAARMSLNGIYNLCVVPNCMCDKGTVPLKQQFMTRYRVSHRARGRYCNVFMFVILCYQKPLAWGRCHVLLCQGLQVMAWT